MRILYIDLDSLRPDHLSCYGYHRQTSPNIDALAAEGVRFTNVYASDTPCLPSRTAFFGGRFGVKTGVVNHGGAYADLPPEGAGRGFRSEFAETTLASMLRQAGYYTASVSPFPNRHTAYQVWQGFSETHDTGRGGLENADEIYPVAQTWLQQRGRDDNWFLHVNLWDPHAPYDHPEAYGNPFATEPIDDWLTQELLDAQNLSYGPHSATEVPGFDDQLPAGWRMGVGHVKTLADAKAHLDGYDTGIHYADAFIGRLVQDLKNLGIFEETMIIVSADHGENHGELNIWGDHHTADQATNRLPLIVRTPKATASQTGMVKKAFHYHLDLSSTLGELVGAQQPKDWDGESFAADLSGSSDRGRPYLVLSHGTWSCQRAVRWDKWLLIRTYHTGLKALPAYLLFNLNSDPHETTNLASSQPEVLREGVQKLESWLAEQLLGAWRGDPLWGVINEGGPYHARVDSAEWQGYLERLKQTGRSNHAARLEAFGGQPYDTGLE